MLVSGLLQSVDAPPTLHKQAINGTSTTRCIDFDLIATSGEQAIFVCFVFCHERQCATLFEPFMSLPGRNTLGTKYTVNPTKFWRNHPSNK